MNKELGKKPQNKEGSYQQGLDVKHQHEYQSQIKGKLGYPKQAQ
jgi:hypothetical protein